MIKFKLFLRIFPLLTPKKVINFFLLEASYFLSRLLKKPVMSGLPWAVSVEPTTLCNLHCPECPTGMRKLGRQGGSMQLSMFEQIMEKMSQHLIYLTLYFQGEPFLNKDFLQMIHLAKSRKLLVSTSTNGHFLTADTARQLVESGLDRLIISLDGTNQETYEKYRIGGNFTTVVSGIKEVVHWKKKLKKNFPLVELQFLVLGTNEHQIQEIRKMALELGVNKLTLKSAQLYSLENNPFLTTMPGYKRYAGSTGPAININSSLPDYCHRMWNSPVITWDGKIIPCCFDKNAGTVLGMITESEFALTWKSDKYKNFRKSVFTHRKNIPICCNCSEGLKTNN